MGRFFLLVALMAGAAAPAQPPEPEGPDGLLVMGVVGREGSASAVHGERAVVADPRTGAIRSRSLPGGTLCYSEVLAVGDRVVYSGYRGRRAVALSLPHSLTGGPRSLGEAETATQSATPGLIWLGRWREVRETARADLREVDPGTGRVASRTTEVLPRWGRLEAATGEGFVFGHADRLTLWEHRLDRPLRSVRDAWLVAAGRSSFAWCGPKCRVLRVWSPGGERRFEPPATIRLRTGSGALSPDAARLAVPVTHRGAQRVAVVDLDDGSWTVVPGGALRRYEAMAWSPSGRWLYFTGRRLLGWELGSPSAVPLPVDPGGAVMSIATAAGRRRHQARRTPASLSLLVDARR